MVQLSNKFAFAGAALLLSTVVVAQSSKTVITKYSDGVGIAIETITVPVSSFVPVLHARADNTTTSNPTPASTSSASPTEAPGSADDMFLDLFNAIFGLASFDDSDIFGGLLSDIFDPLFSLFASLINDLISALFGISVKLVKRDSDPNTVVPVIDKLYNAITSFLGDETKLNAWKAQVSKLGAQKSVDDVLNSASGPLSSLSSLKAGLDSFAQSHPEYADKVAMLEAAADKLLSVAKSALAEGATNPAPGSVTVPSTPAPTSGAAPVASSGAAPTPAPAPASSGAEPTPAASSGAVPAPAASSGAEPAPAASSGAAPAPAPAASSGATPAPAASSGAEPAPAASSGAAPAPAPAASSGAAPAPAPAPAASSGAAPAPAASSGAAPAPAATPVPAPAPAGSTSIVPVTITTLATKTTVSDGKTLTITEPETAVVSSVVVVPTPQTQAPVTVVSHVTVVSSSGGSVVTVVQPAATTVLTDNHSAPAPGPVETATTPSVETVVVHTSTAASTPVATTPITSVTSAPVAPVAPEHTTVAQVNGASNVAISFGAALLAVAGVFIF